jgi:hypothetical protein
MVFFDLVSGTVPDGLYPELNAEYIPEFVIDALSLVYPFLRTRLRKGICQPSVSWVQLLFSAGYNLTRRCTKKGNLFIHNRV